MGLEAGCVTDIMRYLGQETAVSACIEVRSKKKHTHNTLELV